METKKATKIYDTVLEKLFYILILFINESEVKQGS